MVKSILLKNHNYKINFIEEDDLLTVVDVKTPNGYLVGDLNQSLKRIYFESLIDAVSFWEKELNIY